MSLHVEWLNTHHWMSTEVVPSGSWIGEDVVGEGNVALVLWYDEAVVIEGSKAQLRQRLSKMLAQVEKASPSDPVPEDFHW